jgi:hypothetical protein
MSDLHDVRVAGTAPLFHVDIKGITIPMRRLGWTEDGDAYLEVAETCDGLRDVLPQDYATVDPHGNMRAEVAHMNGTDRPENWDYEYQPVGKVTGARLQVGKSL